MINVAIVVITYNRLDSLKRLIHSLLLANYDDQVDLIVSIDRSDIFEKMYNYASTIQWPHGKVEIRTTPVRLGLKQHVMRCGEILQSYEHIVVLEDDLYVSPGFYQYTKEMIVKYEADDDIAGISLYNYPRNQYANLPFYPQQDKFDVYFMKIASSWGQVWSRHKWQSFLNWLQEDKKLEDMHIPMHIKRWDDKSWLKFHHAYCALENKYFVYPRVALSTNFSEPGEHASLDSTYQVEILKDIKHDYKLPNSIHEAIRYDEFFENENIKETIPYHNVSIDLYGQKYLYNQYVLSTKQLNFEIVESYALRMKPWEANVIAGVKGEGIYLYNIGKREFKNRFKVDNNVVVYKYLFRINSPREIFYILISQIKGKFFGLKK
ncbi:glycosyltransferase [Acinetobacter sp. NIPH 298]|uniref:glycosyltransferase n=1 Tax=Acinetobacter sp. NIPH 298 TaxID=1217692 RepID=UPI0002CF92A8|nr:glycosyltransferase [Acinetobacter sp. NIPH 298]ENW96775.1 hypothetical protein F903_00581 [Acinetobacter sp. NIPH 298]